MTEIPSLALGFALGFSLVGLIVWLVGIVAGMHTDRAGEWVGFHCRTCGFPTIVHRAEWDGQRRCTAHRPGNATLAARNARRVSVYQNRVRGREKGAQR